MDRSWMQSDRMSDEYAKRVEEFLNFAKSKLPKTVVNYSCPCVIYVNLTPQALSVMKDYLFVHGICMSYTKWIWHGESRDTPSVSRREKVDEDMNDRMEDMIRDIGPESFKRAHMYDTLCKDKEEALYLGCKKFARLSTTLRLINPKAINGWTDKGFTELHELLKDMLPEGNTLPNRTYYAKKILCLMGVGYQKIHACPNDCILCRNDFDKLHKCTTCNLSRYKVKTGDSNSDDDDVTKGSPAKVLWYLPIIPRFQRLFANPKDAKNIRWHVDERKCGRQLRHPADSLQWKKVDRLFPDFGAEPRNLRLALASDGMNPFGNLSTNHSLWPVLLVIYNLSPWLCMKHKYVMLSMMISGPRQPGNDIDVYLSPLVEDLRKMWNEGVDVFDGYSGETFKLLAMFFCTINGFSAYGNLSGYSVKGYKACPICAEGAYHHQLKHGRKTIYLGHRKFLRRHHPYHRLKKAFDGCQENGIAPNALTEEKVYQVVKDINIAFGEMQKQSNENSNCKWKKRYLVTQRHTLMRKF